MSFVTKSITIPNVPEFAYAAMTGPKGPLTLTNLLLQICGGEGKSYLEGTGMVYEASGEQVIVDAAIAAVQEKVPEFVSRRCNEALGDILLAMLTR